MLSSDSCCACCGGKIDALTRTQADADTESEPSRLHCRFPCGHRAHVACAALAVVTSGATLRCPHRSHHYLLHKDSPYNSHSKLRSSVSSFNALPLTSPLLIALACLGPAAAKTVISALRYLLAPQRRKDAVKAAAAAAAKAILYLPHAPQNNDSAASDTASSVVTAAATAAAVSALDLSPALRTRLAALGPALAALLRARAAATGLAERSFLLAQPWVFPGLALPPGALALAAALAAARGAGERAAAALQLRALAPENQQQLLRQKQKDATGTEMVVSLTAVGHSNANSKARVGGKLMQGRVQQHQQRHGKSQPQDQHSPTASLSLSSTPLLGDNASKHSKIQELQTHS